MRLILSTYQDGTGMLKNKKNPMKVKTLPGWRDFERAVAIAFDGEAEALPEYIKDPIQKKAALYFPDLWED